MSFEFTFNIRKIDFNEDYTPADNTRLTTNFANLARGEHRKENLRNVLCMIENRFNALADWDNRSGDRYGVEIEIISVDMISKVNGADKTFPLIEILNTTVVDRVNNRRIPGLAGNNFSSYVRDYDFSVLLLDHNRDRSGFSVPEKFGDLHGNLFRSFIDSEVYRANFSKKPVICLSVASNRTYHRTTNIHPVLGVEYEQRDYSLTDQYFEKMGMKVRYFAPKNCTAPLAFYFFGDLLSDYSNLELISTISTMESFQRVYRPEIYNANSVAGDCYSPSLHHKDYSPTRIVYDREERGRLAVEQGQFTAETFITPYQDVLEQWSARYAA